MKKSMLVATLFCLANVAAAAQFARPEDAIKYRKAAFTVLSTHFARIGAMANGKVPFDAKALADNAAIVMLVQKLPYTAFVAGTDKGDTRAKPEVWTEAEKFRAAEAKMHEAMDKMDAAIKSGNLATIKTSFGVAAQSCKACHDQFRKE